MSDRIQDYLKAKLDFVDASHYLAKLECYVDCGIAVNKKDLEQARLLVDKCSIRAVNAYKEFTSADLYNIKEPKLVAPLDSNALAAIVYILHDEQFMDIPYSTAVNKLPKENKDTFKGFKTYEDAYNFIDTMDKYLKLNEKAS